MQDKVCSGAMLSCTFGTGPAQLRVYERESGDSSVKPPANIADNKTLMNIQSFCMCTSPANPMNAAMMASSGIMGASPCLPITGTPWVGGDPSNLIRHFPSLKMTSIAQCAWGGIIRIVSP